MTDYVVDASVALKWFVPENDSNIAERLLNSDAILHAPRFLAIETTNAAWKNWRKKLVDESVVRSVGERLPRFIENWYADESLCGHAMHLSLTLDHPIFDCLYLVLAQRLGFRVITSDKRMSRIAPQHLILNLDDWK